MAKINIVFKIDANGELSVKAIDPDTNVTAMVEIQRPSRFLQEEIDDMAFHIRAMNFDKRSKHDYNALYNAPTNAIGNVSKNDDGAIIPISMYGELSSTKIQKEFDLMEDE